MQISNDWFVAETEFENKSLIIRGRLFLDAIRQSGKFATRIALVWEYQGGEKGMPTEKETQALDSLNEKLRDRKSTRLNSSHNRESRMPSSA